MDQQKLDNLTHTPSLKEKLTDNFFVGFGLGFFLPLIALFTMGFLLDDDDLFRFLYFMGGVLLTSLILRWLKTALGIFIGFITIVVIVIAIFAGSCKLF